MYHTYYAAHIYPVWNIDILYICSQLLDVTSFSWFVVVSAACVYATGLLLQFAPCRTSTVSVEPLPRGWRAVAFPRWLSVLNL